MKTLSIYAFFNLPFLLLFQVCNNKIGQMKLYYEETNHHNKTIIVMFVILLALPYITNINMLITFRSISKIKNNNLSHFTANSAFSKNIIAITRITCYVEDNKNNKNGELWYCAEKGYHSRNRRCNWPV